MKVRTSICHYIHFTALAKSIVKLQNKMITLTLQLYLISASILSVTGAVDLDKLASSSLGSKPPLILIQTYATTLARPTFLSFIKNLRLQSRLDFGTSTSTDEVFFCPAESPKQITILEKENELENKLISDKHERNEISKHCLFGKTTIKRNFTKSVPQCKNDPQPVILHDTREKPSSIEERRKITYQPVLQYTPCGRIEKKEKLFKVGYQGYQLDDVRTFPLYEFCYNYENSQIVYIKHEIMSPKLLKHQAMRQEREKVYDIDTLSHHDINISFASLKEVYEKIEHTNIKKPQRLDTLEYLHQFRFKKQFLASPDDFAFGLWRKGAFHYANISLMQETLLQTWNHIGKLIRDYSIKLDEEFEVYTAAFKLSIQTSERVYIMEEIQIPEIWVKIVHHNYVNPYPRDMKDKYPKRAVAIIANNYLTDDLSKKIKDFYCEEDLCPDSEAEEISKFSLFVKCCAVTDNLQDLFEIKLEFEGVLPVENLIKNSEAEQSPKSIYART